MATILNYTVDTKPMANEIKNVSSSVSKTTIAVAAMQTAVILAEEKATQKVLLAEEKAANLVCSNVNKGFYSLIRSQISQKMAKLQLRLFLHFGLPSFPLYGLHLESWKEEKEYGRKYLRKLK